jgi:hypothetical protein
MAMMSHPDAASYILHGESRTKCTKRGLNESTRLPPMAIPSSDPGACHGPPTLSDVLNPLAKEGLFSPRWLDPTVADHTRPAGAKTGTGAAVGPAAKLFARAPVCFTKTTTKKLHRVVHK